MKRGGIMYSLLILLVCLGISRPSLAQSSIVWSAPVRLSDPKVQAWAPAIATDPAGNVYMVWSQTLTEDQSGGEGDTLFYSRWDGQAWSPPVDVLVSPQGSAEFPDMAITPDGMLHVVWGTSGENSKMMYSRAPACCADNRTFIRLSPLAHSPHLHYLSAT